MRASDLGCGLLAECSSCCTGAVGWGKSPLPQLPSWERWGVLSVLLSSQGTAYHVRVSAYNMKGWGPPQASTPPFAIPSSEYPWEHPRGSQNGAGGTGQPPVPFRGPSHCWDGSDWSQGQSLESQARQGCCAWGSGMLPATNKSFTNSEFSALNYPCHLGKSEPFQATGSAHPMEEAGRWQRARTQRGPGWQWPPSSSVLLALLYPAPWDALCDTGWLFPDTFTEKCQKD